MFNKILNVILVILLILIIGAAGYLGYIYYTKFKIESEKDKFLSEEFDRIVIPKNVVPNEPQEPENGENENTEPTSSEEHDQQSAQINQNNNSVPLTYKGFPVLGKLEMPSINIKYPILAETTEARAIEVSVVKIYGPELNQPGNFVIGGHNYNNGLFFGKNKNLKIGDKIYITDLNANKVEYTIYNKYYVKGDEFSYVSKDTEGRTEVTLYTCDATGAKKLIVCARKTS